MIQRELPREIEIVVPGHFPDDSTQFVDMHTRLFRGIVKLPEALDRTYDRLPQGTIDLSVFSAGCSTGAEADYVLSLHRSREPAGRVRLLGVDFNPDAIKHAKQGRYKLVEAPVFEEDLTELRQTLEAQGFEVDFDNPDYEVDSSRLREGHDLTFVQGDLSKTLPTKSSSFDLVLANNVLYHMRPAAATAAIQNLAKLLTENGVLSIGETTDKRLKSRMGPRRHLAPETYGQWLAGIPALLRQEFGIRPIAFGRWEQPTMFSSD